MSLLGGGGGGAAGVVVVVGAGPGPACGAGPLLPVVPVDPVDPVVPVEVCEGVGSVFAELPDFEPPPFSCLNGLCEGPFSFACETAVSSTLTAGMPDGLGIAGPAGICATGVLGELLFASSSGTATTASASTAAIGHSLLLTRSRASAAGRFIDTDRLNRSPAHRLLQEVLLHGVTVAGATAAGLALPVTVLVELAGLPGDAPAVRPCAAGTRYVVAEIDASIVGKPPPPGASVIALRVISRPETNTRLFVSRTNASRRLKKSDRWKKFPWNVSVKFSVGTPAGPTAAPGGSDDALESPPRREPAAVVDAVDVPSTRSTRASSRSSTSSRRAGSSPRPARSSRTVAGASGPGSRREPGSRRSGVGRASRGRHRPPAPPRRGVRSPRTPGRTRSARPRPGRERGARWEVTRDSAAETSEPSLLASERLGPITSSQVATIATSTPTTTITVRSRVVTGPLRRSGWSSLPARPRARWRPRWRPARRTRRCRTRAGSRRNRPNRC